MAEARARVLAELADLIPRSVGGAPVRVAIDGVDGSGKTWLGDELAVVLRARGRPVVRASADGFHHSRDVRYR